jgi:hypothetical protein
MASNGADFRARAMELAAKARATSPQTADVEGSYKPIAQMADPVHAQMAGAMDDAYSRRGLGGPLAAGAAQDATLQSAVTKQAAYRDAVKAALARRRGGIQAAYGAASAQEQVNEALRQLEEKRRQQEAAKWGEIAGAGGMVLGTIYGGPAGGAAGYTAGKTIGTKAGGG